MAKFTPFLGDLSGKLKGLVFAFNKAGSYVRGFRMPTDPATNAQLNNRSYFANAVSSWHALSDINKGLWNAFATGPFKAKFPKAGVAYSGYNAFVSLYNVVKNAIVKSGDVTIVTPAAASTTSLEFINSSRPPTTGLSSSIQAPAGVPLGFVVSTVDIVTTTSTCGITLVFDRSVGTGPTPEGPIFQDAIGNEPVGFAVVASLPLTQQEQFVENPDINLVAISKPMDTIDDWVIGNTMTFTAPLVPEFFTRKNNYVAGDLIQCKIYLVGQSGQTMPVGSVFTTVGI